MQETKNIRKNVDASFRMKSISCLITAKKKLFYKFKTVKDMNILLVKQKFIKFVTKIPLAMRLILLFLIMFTGVSWAENTYAQNAKISIDAQNQTIANILENVEQQSEFSFIYDSKSVDTERKVSVRAENENIFDVLSQMFAGSDIAYTVVNKKIILNKNEEMLNLAQQQQGTPITGTVTDKNGEAIPGVNVTVKGTSIGTNTDVNGKFTLSVEQNAVLQISYLGYVSQEIRVTGSKVYNIKLVEDVVALNEVVTIGYGTVKRSDLTGAIASLTNKDLSTNIESKVMDAIQGKVAGLSIESLGGEPGSSMRIQIRGAGSLTNNNPLVLIDGVPGSMEMLNTNNVKSMQILKDASAAAIYGARAANGVILIETTDGHKGDVLFSVNVDYGIQQLTNKMPMLNAEQWRQVNNDARAAAGLPPSNYILDYLGDLPTKGTDWQDAMYVNAPIGKYNISASGGTESSKYNFSLGYLNQDGIVQTTKFNQLNIQAKSDFKKGRFKFGESLIITKEYKKIRLMTEPDAATSLKLQ